ncbi:MAG TPA: TIGR03435 family protein [Bryobacteraceae bacterium]|nr:TIGR03435 family protein [Bryobacteraceae bacterium]
MRAVAVLMCCACAAWAQQDDAPPSFEVASVKPAGPFGPDGRVVRGCSKPDPAMLHCVGVGLRALLMRAYGVKGYQIEGPGLNSESYNVMAKVPDGAPADKIPAMLQALLTERFAVKIHKETRVIPAYELIVAKGGPKLKEVDVANLPPTPEPGSPWSRPARAPGGGPPALRSMPAGAVMEIVGVGDSRIRGNMSVDQLINVLTNSLDRPVLDNTGLKGTYEIELSYVGDENRSDVSTQGATIFEALQRTLGLKLEPRKAPVEIIVVDSANKVPRDN